MLKRLFALVLLTLSVSGSAQGAEAGFQLSKGIAIGGYVAAGVGPVLSLAGAFAAVGSATNGNTNGVLGGGALALTGIGLTAIAPAVVVGSAAGGYLAVKDMGGSPSIAPTIVGAAGVGLQVIGWGLTIAGANQVASSGNLPATYSIGTACRVIGWGTGLIGGGVQLVSNARGARDAVGRTPTRPKLRMSMVPMGRGAALVGQF